MLLSAAPARKNKVTIGHLLIHVYVCQLEVEVLGEHLAHYPGIAVHLVLALFEMVVPHELVWLEYRHLNYVGISERIDANN